MALTDSKLVNIPIVESEVIQNSKSPIFHAGYMAETEENEMVNGSDSSNSPPGSSIDDESDSQSPNSAADSGSPSTKKKSMSSGSLTSSSSSGAISKMVPVTGERPRPENTEPPLDDEVLHAVFLILWEQDSQQQGMTVKQICDLLVEIHPDITKLSTKLSNLVSAKLNAYVKKVEKGEKALKYALSREWSDASPRRMVYVYRGILAPEYQQLAKAASARQKAKQQQSNPSAKQKKMTPSSLSSQQQQSQQSSQLQRPQQNLDFNSTLVDAKNVGTFARTLGVNNNGFSNGIYGNSELNIPYATSPVSLGLATKQPIVSPNNCTVSQNPNMKRMKPIAPDDTSRSMPFKKAKTNNWPKGITSGAKTNSTQSNVLPADSSKAYITAAAAAPRLSKIATPKGMVSATSTISASSSSFIPPTFPSFSTPSSSNVSAATVITAIHRAVITQTPITVKLNMSQKSQNQNIWIKTIRDGFLAEEIDSPESVTVDQLDEMFD
ncbi:Gds1p Ecym_5033 [Eremothecium cymbalariae DBVPG|uniref:GDS1 winged helix domain-containing protein n=1 Tax=Eremothecium cymbalariae (strain CBS 270.75 / DBVPG 7215 / KCTC 17166 / NRRL Y-17582) TaxID=931890 RepID=I6NCP1_ERECY|nr:hypothetical protein Ecym_5033 [Eremothecium cymbalariae DBVPG\